MIHSYLKPLSQFSHLMLIHYLNIEPALPPYYVQMWQKFGAAQNDPAGPNPSNTIMAEEVFMQFVQSKDSQPSEEVDQDPLGNIHNNEIIAKMTNFKSLDLCQLFTTEKLGQLS